MRKYALELRYSLLAALLTVVVLRYGYVYPNFDGLVERAESIGIIGGGGIAFASNAILFIHVPYNLSIIPAAIHADSLLEILIFGMAVGGGAGLGEAFAYWMAYKVNPGGAPEWLLRLEKRYPRFLPLLVFLSAALPMPDGLVIISLAMLKYPPLAFAVLVLAGKLVHNLAYALLAYYAAEWLVSTVSSENTLQYYLTALVFILFSLSLLYQLEKTFRR